jgi:hypothetical protein
MTCYQAKSDAKQLIDFKLYFQPVLNPDSRTKDFVLINRWKAKQYNKIERGDIVSIV